VRSAPALFFVCAALFVAAIAFLVIGARAPRVSAGAPVAPPPPPVASLKQIMTAIVLPNAQKIYDAVGYTSSKDGMTEVAPKNDAEWQAVAASAAALVESGHLMMSADRRVDAGEWLRMTTIFVDAAKASLNAANEKNVDGIFASGGDLNETCDTCHARYQRQ
jgi:hypothetical protein